MADHISSPDIGREGGPVRLRHPDRLFIDGRWIAPVAGGGIDVVSAHSEAVIARVAEATAPDMDAAVAAARRAFDDGSWPRLSPEERAARLGRFHAALAPRVPELVAAWIDQIGAVFTRDPARAYRIARRMRTGTVTHNVFRFDPLLPFGGFKQSGIGREGGVEGLTAYTEVKSILLDDAPA